MSNVLGRICTACGQERKKKDMLAYHPETFEPYCSSYYYCNDEHPNSPKNLALNITKYPETYGETPLLPYEAAKEAYSEWVMTHHENPEKVKRIRKMVASPLTLRLNSPELAEFILDLQQEMEFSSVSDTIRFCIHRMQEEHGGFHQTQEKIKQETREHENMEKVVAAVSKPEPSPVSKEPESNDDLFSF